MKIQKYSKKNILPDFIKNLLILLFISSSFIDTFIKYESQSQKGRIHNLFIKKLFLLKII